MKIVSAPKVGPPPGEVRLGSKADIDAGLDDVRLSSERDITPPMAGHFEAFSVCIRLQWDIAANEYWEAMRDSYVPLRLNLLKSHERTGPPLGTIGFYPSRHFLALCDGFETVKCPAGMKPARPCNISIARR